MPQIQSHNKYLFFYNDYALLYIFLRGCCGRDRMVVGFTTTYAISAYPFTPFEGQNS